MIKMALGGLAVAVGGVVLVGALAAHYLGPKVSEILTAVQNAIQ